MSNKTIPTIHNNGVDKTFVWDFENELRKSNNFNAPEGHVYELSKGELPSKAFTEAYYSPNSVFLKAVGERLLKYFNKKKPIDYSKAAEKALKRYNKSLVINVNFPYQYSYGYPGTHETYLFLGTLPDWPTQWPKEFVYGHESGHLIEPYHRNSKFLNKYLRKLLDLNTNTVVEGDEKATKHDSQHTDKRADLQGMRALLYLMGLFNPSTDTEISMESIKKLREQYPDLRPVKQMDDETLYKLLNLVAYNSNKTKLNLQYAKEGVKLKYIKKFLIPAGAIENEDGTFWSDEKIEGLTPIKIEKIDTGQTKKVKVGTKRQYQQVDGTWSDEFNENSVVGTINSRGKRFYKRAGENYTVKGNYGSVHRTVNVYEDQPVYRGRYLYKKDLVKPKPSTPVSSKPVLPSRPNIPDLYKEGLAEIKDGLTYYTFPKYTNDQVTQAIQELFGNDIPTLKLLYQDYTPDNKKSATLQNATSNYQDSELPDQNAKSSNQKVELTNIKDNKNSLIDKITNLFSFNKSKNKIKPKEIVIQDPEFKEYYAYPYEVDLFYNISPLVYSLVLSRLESKYGGEDKLKKYIFTEKPLTYYKPGETFRDTVYTFVNSGGVLHQPLVRSTLNYKNDKISEPFDITQGINGAWISDLNFSEYIPKIKDNKVKIPSKFSYYIDYPYFHGDVPEPTYKPDFENMDLNEKEKFKQYLKNRYPDVEWILNKDTNYSPEEYFYFKLTDSQKNKIDQIYNKNKQSRERYTKDFE